MQASSCLVHYRWTSVRTRERHACSHMPGMRAANCPPKPVVPVAGHFHSPPPASHPSCTAAPLRGNMHFNYCSFPTARTSDKSCIGLRSCRGDSAPSLRAVQANASGFENNNSNGSASVLCDLASIPDGGAKGFTVRRPGKRDVEIVVNRDGEMALGWVNRCPHVGTSLEMFEDEFLTPDGTLFICATHGALFRKTDGFCVRGPCAGAALAPFPVQIVDGKVLVTCS